jgi:hypothetical protein
MRNFCWCLSILLFKLAFHEIALSARFTLIRFMAISRSWRLTRSKFCGQAFFSDLAEPSNFVLEFSHPNDNKRSYCVCNVIGRNIEFGEAFSIGRSAYARVFTENHLYFLMRGIKDIISVSWIASYFILDFFSRSSWLSIALTKAKLLSSWSSFRTSLTAIFVW